MGMQGCVTGRGLKEGNSSIRRRRQIAREQIDAQDANTVLMQESGQVFERAHGVCLSDAGPHAMPGGAGWVTMPAMIRGDVCERLVPRSRRAVYHRRSSSQA